MWVTGVFVPASVKSDLCLSHVHRVADSTQRRVSQAPQTDNNAADISHTAAMDPIRTAVQLDGEKY